MQLTTYKLMKIYYVFSKYSNVVFTHLISIVGFIMNLISWVYYFFVWHSIA